MVSARATLKSTTALKSFIMASGKMTSETVRPNLASDCFTRRFSGSGICERTDGFKYEGLWLNNRRHGYGITTFKDGSREEGKYKHNQFCAVKKSKLSIRSGKAKEKIENALKMARKAAEVAKQKAEIAMTR
jgi:junctophilin